MNTINFQGAGVDLNALRVFVAVADAASFSVAAKRLNLPKWSVSRRLAELEAAMGVPLLHRTTRHVALSPIGAALHERVASLLLSLDQATSKFPDLLGEPTGEVRISAPNYLGSAFLADAITIFKTQYPAVHVDLSLTSQPMDFAIEGFDIAIRAAPARMKDSSLVARPACPIFAQLFASPKYLAGHGTPSIPGDLAGHEWVTQRGVPIVRLDSPDGPANFKPHGGICTDDIFFVREAVRSGAGIGMLPIFLAEKDIANGQLVRVLPRYRTIAAHVYILRPGTREVPRRVKLLSDFLFEYLKDHPLAAPVKRRPPS